MQKIPNAIQRFISVFIFLLVCFVCVYIVFATIVLMHERPIIVNTLHHQKSDVKDNQVNSTQYIKKSLL